MQTATAQLVHPTTHLEQEARILFDSGSYRTYVTQDLADSLKLTIEGREHISVMTFGCSKVQQITASTTVLHLKLADGSVFPITATVVPKIRSQKLVCRSWTFLAHARFPTPCFTRRSAFAMARA